MKKYTFKIYPKGRGREAYRVIEMPGSRTLDDLCDYIMEIFNFIHEHLYEFCMDNRMYSEYSYMYHPEPGHLSTSVRIDDIGLVKGQKFSLHYDYGDDWMFVINVQKIEEIDIMGSPALLKSKGNVEQYPSWDEWEDDEE